MCRKNPPIFMMILSRVIISPPSPPVDALIRHLRWCYRCLVTADGECLLVLAAVCHKDDHPSVDILRESLCSCRACDEADVSSLVILFAPDTKIQYVFGE